MAVTNYHTVNGRIIGETTAGVRTDYLTDALGSVTATVNSSGTVVNRYRYKPYGALLTKSGVGADPAFQYVGVQGYRQTQKKYSDVYVRARHYDTANGRWTSKDPDWRNAQELFQYCRVSPATRRDPSGLQSGPPIPILSCINCDCPKHPCQDDPCGYKNEGSGGWVACCNGFMYPCLSKNNRESSFPGIVRCAYTHELQHIIQVLLGAGYCGDPVTGARIGCCGFGFMFHNRGWDQLNECEAYRAEVECLTASQQECDKAKDPKYCHVLYKHALCIACCWMSPKRMAGGKGRDCTKVSVAYPKACYDCPGFPDDCKEV